MDGTLLDDQKNIGPETLRQIDRAAEQGKIIALCTGRGVAELNDFLDILKGVRYAICASGGIIWDMQKKEKIYSRKIDVETAFRIFDLMKDKDVVRQILEVKNILTASDLPQLERFRMHKYRPSYERWATLVEDTEKYYRAAPYPVEKLDFHFTNTPDCRSTVREVKDAGLPVEVVGTGMGTLEINAAGVCKGSTLLHLCRILNIDPSEAIAVGDSYNDINMLEVVGLPVAVANANDEVKKICRAVVPDNNHEGCAEAIDKYLMAPQ